VTIARVHATEARSRANGPGTRFVVWLQGCSLGCPGCFNPSTHDAAGGEPIEVDALLGRLGAPGDVDGVTLSGGEPLEQPEATLALLRGARARGLSTLIFSGFTIEEIRGRRLGAEILAELDVLIDGRYRSTDRLAAGLRGSANQRIHLLTARHSLAEVEATPVAEVRIDPRGGVILTGVAPLPLRRR
jgi:anaerobic ribonucleoside-triphosphate reductase activating protein